MIDSNNWKVKYSGEHDELPFIERLMAYRGINEADLKKEDETFFDAAKMNDMPEAIDRIVKAIKNGERILVFGDYDVDGIMATTIMTKGLRFFGAECVYFIPDRFNDGYGISENTEMQAMLEFPNLIISVDCGITAKSSVERFSEQGIDTIITDHHDCPEELPNAVAVIDCKRPDNTYPFNALCGAGIAYKLICKLGDTLKAEKVKFDKKAWETAKEEFLQLAAIATVADVVPLRSENRAVVKKGLELIHSNPITSIASILANMEKPIDNKAVSAQDIAFYVAPLLNASSRMGNVNTAMALMNSDDIAETTNLAISLVSLNNQRKIEEGRIMDEATACLMANHAFRSSNAVIVYGYDWHRGVIGIVAAKLAETYRKPAIVLSASGDGYYHGSCRTYGDINIMDILENSRHAIAQYGGHAGAAGLTIHGSQLDAFIRAVNEYMAHYDVSAFEPTLDIEMAMTPDEITLENAEALKEKLEPFGEGNREPLFVCTGLRVKTLKKIGTKEGAVNAHAKFVFCSRKDVMKTIDGIAFFKGEYGDVIGVENNVNVVFSLGINEWNGNKSVQLLIKEIRYNSKADRQHAAEEQEMCDMYSDGEITIEDITDNMGIDVGYLRPTRDEYVKTAAAIRNMLNTTYNKTMVTTLPILTGILSTNIRQMLTIFKVDRILDACNEAGVFEYRKDLFGKIVISRPYGKHLTNISMTNTYKKDHGLLTQGNFM